MHHIGEVGLNLRLGDVDNLEAVLHEKLLASDRLGTRVLPPVVGAHLAHQGGNAGLVRQTHEEVYYFYPGVRRLS